ncbi:MAG: BadF/BadG/BcrA/BcrD ATPase family protein [Verrucomicrobiota bacterium]
MKKFTYVLAIDPGGSKCAALLVKADGTLLAQCQLRDWATGGRDPRLMRRTITRVLAGHAPGPMLISSIGGRRWHKYLPAPWHDHVHILEPTEPLSALATTGHSFGVVVIAGTGARVARRTRTGQEFCLDALGPVLGDGGSGYYIGRETLRAVAREIQLRRPATRLRRRVLRACDCAGLGGLICFSLLARDRSRIAALTKIVDEEARAGDRLARRLLQHGATVMAGTVRELVTHLGIARQELPLVGAGSVAAQSDIYWRAFCRQVRQFAPRFHLRQAPLPPVAGLAALGLRNATATAKLFATLKKEIKS